MLTNSARYGASGPLKKLTNMAGQVCNKSNLYLDHHYIWQQKKRSKTCSNCLTLDRNSAVEPVLVQEKPADKYETLNVREIQLSTVLETIFQIGGAELPNWRCPSSGCSTATDACMKVLSTEKLLSIHGRFQKVHLFKGAGHIESSGSRQSKIILF